MGDLSTHFSRSEFRSKDGGALPPEFPTRELIGRLEALRCRMGKPLRIVSGHRTPQHNAAVGGATDSQHLQGTAADLEVGYARVEDAAAVGFRGIGSKNGWATHVDVRAVPARWTY